MKIHLYDYYANYIQFEWVGLNGPKDIVLPLPTSFYKRYNMLVVMSKNMNCLLEFP